MQAGGVDRLHHGPSTAVLVHYGLETVELAVALAE
jgi:hypothetical protein